MQCIAEAARAAAALAKGARKEWSRDAKVLLPGMLDKLKDKTSAVIVALQSALDESIKYCFELGEAVDEACVAVVAQSSQSSSRNAQMAREDVRRHESCLHKRLTQVYRTAHREVHERVESRRANGQRFETLASVRKPAAV